MLDRPLPSDDTQSGPAGGSVLFVTAVRLRMGARGLQIDDQTAAGICRWAEHFDFVTFAGIRIEAEKEDQTSVSWVDVADLPCAGRLSFIELPYAYKLKPFISTYRRTRRILAEAIRGSDHLCFTLGYLIGDWAAVAAQEAIAQRRRYAVWFDRVEHDVLRNTLSSLHFRRRVKERMTIPAMIRYHRFLIRRSALGLFQGRETFDALAGYSGNPACVYDVHTQREDRIDTPALERKKARITSGAPLRICYAGRVAAMKGPKDWVAALAHAVRAGVPLEACWLGDGPLLEEMRVLVRENGLEENIRLEGHVGDRDAVLSAMQESDLFVFCHKTPESPRCLIEALVCGCPIVGYGSPYPQGLIADGGGGRLTPPNNPAALGRMIVQLHADRAGLAELVGNAARSGERFDEETLYRQRAELIGEFA